MIELRVLGAAELQGTAGDHAAILTQSKVLATLVFLTLATPRGFHRRDRIIGLLWPELDQEHARAALRKAVHVLRRSLGNDAMEVRGDEEVGIAPGALWCDALDFTAAFETKRYARALELYRRGDLLPGFFLPQAGEFEDWLARERSALRDLASAAAWGLAAFHTEGANHTVAGRYARQAATLAPTDERVLRRVMQLLRRGGDRAGALHVYSDFAHRLARDHGALPSGETQQLVAELRAGAE